MTADGTLTFLVSVLDARQSAAVVPTTSVKLPKCGANKIVVKDGALMNKNFLMPNQEPTPLTNQPSAAAK